MLTQDIIQSMKEDELSQKVIIPLLKAMGFHDVFYHHGGIVEQGKDIVCWKHDELSARKNYALVVKAVPITGQAKAGKGTAGEVATQIQQAFGDEFLDPVTAESQAVHECWVITSQKIMPGGEKSILSIIKTTNLERHVKFIDGDKLWDLVEKYLAIQTPLGRLLEVQKMLDKIDTHYQPVIHFDGHEMKVSLREKFSGAMKEKPLNFNIEFEFPDTPDGKIARDALKNNYNTGSPVTISSDFIQSIEFPETLKKIFGADFKINKLEISSPPDYRSFMSRLEVVCDDGETFVLSRLELRIKQHGAEEITLESTEKALPLTIRVVLNSQTKLAQIKLGWNIIKESYSCTQLLEVYELQNCLSKPFTFHVLSEELGISLFLQKSNQGIVDAPKKFFFDSLKVFRNLQQKINKPIMIPIRALTDDEIKSIAELIQIVQNGKIFGKWSKLDVELTSVSPDGFNAFSTGPSYLRVSGEQIQEIFDTQIPLGKADTVYSDALLANIKEIQELQRHRDGVKLHFLAKGGKADVEVTYEEYFRGQ